MLLELFAISLLTGLASKIADDRKDLWGLAYGLAYGLLISLVSLWGKDAVSVTLGTVAGVLLAGKIDQRNHWLGVSVFLLSLPLLPRPSLLTLLFFFFAFLDELIHEKGYPRLSLEVATIVASIATKNPVYWLTVLGFDLGSYLIYPFLRRSSTE